MFVQQTLTNPNSLVPADGLKGSKSYEMVLPLIAAAMTVDLFMPQLLYIVVYVSTTNYPTCIMGTSNSQVCKIENNPELIIWISKGSDEGCWDQ